jgi:hypothetical protein
MISIRCSYKAIISTGNDSLFKETHGEESDVDVFELFFILHVLVHIRVDLIADECETKSSLVLNIVTENTSTDICECSG